MSLPKKKFVWLPSQVKLYELGQIEPVVSMPKVVVLGGDTRSGKTFIAGQYLADMSVLFSGMEGVVMAPVKGQSEDTIWRSMQEAMDRNNMKYKVRKTQSDTKIRCEGGSVWTMCNYEGRGTHRVMGREYGMILIDEAHLLSEEQFDLLLSRLSGYGPGMIILICNPQGPAHWIYQRLILGGDAEYIYFSVYDNEQNLAPGYIQMMEKNLTPIMKQRLMEGKWVAQAGLVYDCFELPVNVIDDEKVPPEIHSYWGGIDFGWNHPFAYCRGSLGWDGVMYITNEYRKREMYLESHAKMISQMDAGLRVIRFADHDPQDCRELHKPPYYISSMPAYKDDKIESIMQVYQLFKNKKLKIARSCIQLVNEVCSYSWADGKEKPVKTNDDLVDAMEYLVTGCLRTPVGKKILGEYHANSRSIQSGIYVSNQNSKGERMD